MSSNSNKPTRPPKKEAYPIEKPIEQKLIVQQETHSGPLPSPETFARYAQILPDLPERILTVYEEDSKHVREMNSTALHGAIKIDTRAQILGFSGIALTYAFAAYLAYLDKDIGAALTGVAAVFLSIAAIAGNKKKQENEPDKK